MRKVTAVVAAVLLACVVPTDAALETLSAKSLYGDFSVVIARVKEVMKETDVERDSTHSLIIEPLATIGGRFDPSKQATLKVALWVQSTTSSVNVAPAPNSLVLAVIHPYEIFGEHEMCISSAVLTFMPDESACVTLTGLDDKQIWETLARIREEHAKAAADAKTKR